MKRQNGLFSDYFVSTRKFAPFFRIFQRIVYVTGKIDYFVLQNCLLCQSPNSNMTNVEIHHCCNGRLVAFFEGASLKTKICKGIMIIFWLYDQLGDKGD
jgi:hypothetical protein